MQMKDICLKNASRQLTKGYVKRDKIIAFVKNALY